MTWLVRLEIWVVLNHIDYDMISLSGQVSSWWIVPIMTLLVRLESWIMSNHIDYYMISLSGQVRSWWIVPIMTWLVIFDILGHVKSYWLWNDGYVRSYRILWNCTNRDMAGQIGQFGSCKIILIMTWWVLQVRSDHVKLYQSWHGWSDLTVWVMSKHFYYGMIGLSGQVYHIGSCQIISIITWWTSQVR